MEATPSCGLGPPHETSPAAADPLELRVLKTVAATQRLKLEQVTLDSTFEELGIDSLDAINILFAIETEFDLTVPDEAKTISNMRELFDGVRRLLSAQANA